ncbi:peroxiredoxin family protein [Sediminibacterium soli]|uniref:peroxiredoxin family protein n=1 Tax=Sediminibacterium soli TaxID=2698829 RepID=UPI00137A9918|nr:hypothetical protein [Sediminibacterium soli]NCI47226.1 hypothetical protein [Sediminibacterium soli]
MKKAFVFLIVSLCSMAVSAQTAEQDAPYKKDPTIPAFNILLSDSTWYTANMLPAADKYPYVVIMYFSPTCGHCQVAAKDIVTHMDSLRQVFFVFVSYNPPNEINEFSQVYGLNTLPNVRIGRDPRYFVPAFYRVESTPFTAVYDQKRRLIRVFDPPHNPAIEAVNLIPLVRKK